MSKVNFTSDDAAKLSKENAGVVNESVIAVLDTIIDNVKRQAGIGQISAKGKGLFSLPLKVPEGTREEVCRIAGDELKTAGYFCSISVASDIEFSYSINWVK